MNKLRGSGVALVTPFMANGAVDFDKLSFLIDYQIESGTDYLVVLGTTGETATLSDAERYEILSFVLNKAKGKIGLVAGYGGNDTRHVIKAFTDFPPTDFDAILSVAPYYNKPNQKGLYQHYAAIAKQCPIPVILYNVPGRTACNLTAETTLALANDFSNIVAIKEASGDMVQCMQIINNKPHDFLVISGDDNLTLPFLSCGMDGLISVMANAYPASTHSLVHAALNGNYEKARKIHYQLLDFMQLIFAEGNPTGVKTAMSLISSIKLEDNFRLPIITASKNLKQKLEIEIKNLASKGLVK